MDSEFSSPVKSAAQPSDFLILLVDDVISNLNVLQGMLTKSGYRLMFASSGQQALDRVHQTQPDLLLLDLIMPGFDGLQVAAVMKQNPQWADIPIIFLTASHEFDNLLQAFENGAVDYLIKPFKVPELLARVKIHLELRYLRQQVQIQARNEGMLRQMIEGIHQSLHLTEILNGAAADIQQFLEADRVMICRCQALHPGKMTGDIMAIAQSENAGSKGLADFLVETSPSRSLSLPWIDHCCGTFMTDPTLCSKSFNSPPMRASGASMQGNSVHSNSMLSLGVDPVFSAQGFHNTTYPPVLRVSLPDEPPISADHAEFLDAWQVKTELTLPIFLHHTLWGVVMIHHYQRSDMWRRGEADLLVQVAQQMAIAIQQAELHNELQAANQHLSNTVIKLEEANHELDRLSHVDGLTQVPNRRYFDQYIEQEWLRLRREGRPLTLIVCDIDYFKQFNDTYGHLAGDDALRIVAQALADTLKRPADLLARYGGEEFAAVLPNTSRRGGEDLAEQMRLAVLNLAIPHSEAIASLSVLTISLGVASLVPAQGMMIKSLFAVGDRALYSAKAQGRNCWAIAPVTAASEPVDLPSVS